MLLLVEPATILRPSLSGPLGSVGGRENHAHAGTVICYYCWASKDLGGVCFSAVQVGRKRFHVFFFKDILLLILLYEVHLSPSQNSGS